MQPSYNTQIKTTVSTKILMYTKTKPNETTA